MPVNTIDSAWDSGDATCEYTALVEGARTLAYQGVSVASHVLHTAAHLAEEVSVPMTPGSVATAGMRRTDSLLPGDDCGACGACDGCFNGAPGSARLTPMFEGKPTKGVTPEVAAPMPAKAARARMLLGYAVLLMAFFGSSSMGPAVDLMTGASTMAKMFWRAEGMLVFALCGCAVTYYRRPADAGPLPLPTLREAMELVVMGLAYATWSQTYFISLSYASVMDAYLFNQCHIILVLVFRIVTCAVPRRHALRYGSSLALICGGIYLSVSGLDMQRMIGDIIAFSGTFAAVVFLALAPRVQEKHGLMVCSLTMQISSLLSVVAVSMALSSQPDSGISFVDPFQPDTGVLAWTMVSVSRLGATVFLVIVGGVAGMLGYTWVSSVLPAIIVQAVMLLEPALSGMLAVLCHTGPSPSMDAYIGMVVLVAGSAVVIMTEQAEQREAAEAASATAVLDTRKTLRVELPVTPLLRKLDLETPPAVAGRRARTTSAVEAIV